MSPRWEGGQVVLGLDRDPSGGDRDQQQRPQDERIGDEQTDQLRRLGLDLPANPESPEGDRRLGGNLRSPRAGIRDADMRRPQSAPRSRQLWSGEIVGRIPELRRAHVGMLATTPPAFPSSHLPPEASNATSTDCRPTGRGVIHHARIDRDRERLPRARGRAEPAVDRVGARSRERPAHARAPAASRRRGPGTVDSRPPLKGARTPHGIDLFSKALLAQSQSRLLIEPGDPRRTLT